MMEFTKGPWIFDGVEIRASDSHPMYRICDMAPGFSHKDAMLIAAAPDLLEALQDLKREIILSDVDMDYIDSHFKPWLDKARKAIDKALASNS